MTGYDTIGGKKTYWGKPGANARYVEYLIEQDERIKQKYERKKQKETKTSEKVKVSDKEVDEWIEWCYNIIKPVENESEWEE